MSSVKPDNGSGKIDDTEEVGGAVIVSGSNGAVLFEFGEEILDQVSSLIQVVVVFARFLAV